MAGADQVAVLVRPVRTVARTISAGSTLAKIHVLLSMETAALAQTYTFHPAMTAVLACAGYMFFGDHHQER